LDDASGLLGSWTDSSHPGDVGDTHFCASASAGFFGSYGKQGLVRGTLNGNAATGQYITAKETGLFSITAMPANSDITDFFEGAFVLGLTTSSQNQLNNLIAKSNFNWVETRLRSGALPPTATQCMTVTASSSFQGNWVGGANPPLERGPSGLYSLCVDSSKTPNVIYGSYEPQGYLSGTLDDNNIFRGTFWELDPCGPDRTGDLLMVVTDEYNIYGFKWLGSAGTGEYLGDVHLFRETPDNGQPDQVRLCTRGDIRPQFGTGNKNCYPENSAGIAQVFLPLLLVTAVFAFLF